MSYYDYKLLHWLPKLTPQHCLTAILFIVRRRMKPDHSFVCYRPQIQEILICRLKYKSNTEDVRFVQFRLGIQGRGIERCTVRGIRMREGCLPLQISSSLHKRRSSLSQLLIINLIKSPRIKEN